MLYPLLPFLFRYSFQVKFDGPIVYCGVIRGLNDGKTYLTYDDTDGNEDFSITINGGSTLQHYNSKDQGLIKIPCGNDELKDLPAGNYSIVIHQIRDGVIVKNYTGYNLTIVPNFQISNITVITPLVEPNGFINISHLLTIQDVYTIRFQIYTDLFVQPDFFNWYHEKIYNKDTGQTEYVPKTLNNSEFFRKLKYQALRSQLIPAMAHQLKDFPVWDYYQLKSDTPTGFINMSIWDRTNFAFSNYLNFTVEVRNKPITLFRAPYPNKLRINQNFTLHIKMWQIDPDINYNIYINGSKFNATWSSEEIQKEMDINVVYFDHQITAPSIPGDYYFGGYSTYKDVIIGQTRRTAQKIPVRAPPVVENVTTESSNILKSSNSITFGISYTDLDATDNITAFYKIDDAANYTQYNETFHITSSTGTLTLTCDLPSERTLGEHKIYVMLVDSNDFESNTDKFLKFYIREKPQLTIDSIDKLYYLPGESFIATISISDQDQSDSEKIEYRLESASEYTTLSEGVSASNSIRLPSITIPENSSSSPLKYMIRVTDSYGFSDEKSIDVPLHFKPTITIDEIPTKESFVHGDNIIIHGKATDEDEDDVVTITLNVNNDHYTTTVLANGTDKSFSFNVPVKQEYAIGTLSITVTGVDLYSLDSNQVDLSKPLYFIPVITSVQTVDQQYVSPSNTIKIKVSIQDLDSNDQLTVYYKRQSDTEFTSLPALQTAEREGTFDIPISETATTGDFTITFKVTDSHSLTSQPSPFVVQVRIPPKVQDLSPEKPFFARGESVVVKGNIVDPDSNDEFTITIKFGDLTNSKTVQSAGETTPFSIPLDNVPIGDLTAEISAVDKFGFDSNKPTVAVKVRVAPVISDLSIAANKYKRGDEITLTFKLLDEDINDYVTFTGDISSAAFKDENHVPTTTTARETTLKVVIPEESKSGEDLFHLKAIDSQGLVSNELEHQIYILSNPLVKYEGKSNDGNSKPYDNVTIYFSVTNPDPDETVSVYIKIDIGEKIFVGNVTSPAEDVKLNYTYTVPGNQPQLILMSKT